MAYFIIWFFYIHLLVLLILVLILFNHWLIHYINSHCNSKFTSVVSGVINKVNMGVEEGVNLATGMAWQLNGNGEMVEMGVQVGIKENSMNIIKEGGKLITPKLDFYNRQLKSEGVFSIPQMVSTNSSRLEECEQLLIDMQLLEHIKVTHEGGLEDMQN